MLYSLCALSHIFIKVNETCATLARGLIQQYSKIRYRVHYMFFSIKQIVKNFWGKLLCAQLRHPMVSAKSGCLGKVRNFTDTSEKSGNSNEMLVLSGNFFLKTANFRESNSI